MGAGPSERTQKERQTAEVAKAVADALAQGKSKQEIMEDLVGRGLGKDEARQWVNRAIP